MAPKHPRAKYYVPKDVQLVRSACLSLASYLGSLLDDLVIVGGLVPTLLIPAERLSEGSEAHVGTQDLDLGLSLALLDDNRYSALVEHLESAQFKPDTTNQGKPANHRWKHATKGVTVDFLIAPTEASQTGPKTRMIDESLSAVFIRGLPLAFRDRKKVRLTGKTLANEDFSCEVWVCGPGAFVVLKALAFKGRGEPKDAYDLCYFLEHYGETYVVDVAEALRPLLDDEIARDALTILKENFAGPTSTGPTRAASFRDRDDLDYRADQAGHVQELLRLLEQ